MNRNLPETRAIFNEVLRRDLYSFFQQVFLTVCPDQTFLPSRHIEAYAHYLHECFEGRSTRVIINVPPRCLKSVSVSVAFVAWVLGHDPSARFICVSYSSDLAAKHSRDCRRVMESVWYKKLFPRTRLNPKKNTETEFETTRGGGRLATSVGGTLTGRGGNYIILDDPMKPEEAASASARKKVLEWYSSTLYSRLDNKRTGVIILVSQRLHEDDLSGHLLDTGTWDHLCLPAIAVAPQTIPIGPNRTYIRVPDDVLHPEREPLESLIELRRQLGESKFSAQYQQAPVPPEGALIKAEWFKYFDPTTLDRRDGMIVQSWDTASKSGELHDYSVCTTWCFKRQEKTSYLLDVFRDRLDYPELKRKAIELARQWKVNYLFIEDKGSGTQLLQELKRELSPGETRLRPCVPVGDKIVRMSNETAKIEAGKVLFPSTAPWLAEFVDELRAFPEGKHDDQVDSLSQYLKSMEKETKPSVVVRRMRGR